ncbi:MAG TPA: hypothetical protein VFX98_19565 [Longimicrobiaceae bacterium]|nr:hypothetical protein [Longimicrobiaceae bacterium]
MRNSLFMSLVLLSVVSSPARAQKVKAPLVPGARTRVIAPELPWRMVTGRLSEAGADALVLETRRGALSVPRSSIERLDVSSGRSWRLGAFHGARIGAGLGGVAGAVLALSQPWLLSGLALLLGAAAVGALAGYAVGGTLGAERWVAIPESAVRV